MHAWQKTSTLAYEKPGSGVMWMVEACAPSMPFIEYPHGSNLHAPAQGHDKKQHIRHACISMLSHRHASLQAACMRITSLRHFAAEAETYT